MQERGAWQPYNVSAIVKNVEQVFKNGDISLLNNPTYKFIINSMGFIAHYALGGFQGVYADLRKVCSQLANIRICKKQRL